MEAILFMLVYGEASLGLLVVGIRFKFLCWDSVYVLVLLCLLVVGIRFLRL